MNKKQLYSNRRARYQQPRIKSKIIKIYAKKNIFELENVNLLDYSLLAAEDVPD